MTPDQRVDQTRAVLREAMAQLGESLREEMGIPLPRVGGKLLRPMVALAASTGHGGRAGDRPGEGGGSDGASGPDPSSGLLAGALALQMVHEASLLHDDILDDCALRRGEASLAARAGHAAALVEGDHLLTGAYRVAASTGSLPFLVCFTRAVERTVAGEKAQARAVGRWLAEDEYREIIVAKSGELFGCAASLAANLAGEAEAAARDRALGIRIGELYQRVDDFLDLCPGADLGKPPLLDLGQRKWTWPLAETGDNAFPPEEEMGAFARSLFASPAGGEGGEPSGGPSPMARALARLEEEATALVSAWREAHPADGLVPALVGQWIELVRDTLRREEPGARVDPASPTAEAVRQEALALGGAEGWTASFSRHARSFRFASRLFPPEPGRLVAGVYAFCRFTDDLVDQAPDPDPAHLRARLDVWQALVRQAWERADTGIPLLDEVMGETARRGVGPVYAEELIRGVAMDLDPVEYPTMESLRIYSYRVASVVGLWLTELFGTQTPSVLRRAEAMGHAMQLTNILRDVGEDWHRGRLYLPRDRMVAHGVTPHALSDAMVSGRLPAGWVPLMEELMAVADADYDRAFEAIPALPRFFQRPVAVAARVYQGIHAELRANGHDNLTRRAWTRFPTKVRLGAGALVGLRRARRGFTSPAFLAPPPHAALPGGRG